jgi:exodeoxyribonuclease VII small subunit
MVESDTLTFSESFQNMDKILDQFKKGTPTLEESLELFENGIHHLKNCQDKLTKAKGTVEELVKSLQVNGEVMTRPFEE